MRRAHHFAICTIFASLLLFSQPVTAQVNQRFPRVKGTYLGVQRGSVLVGMAGQRIAVPLGRTTIWFTKGKAETNILRKGMVVGAYGEFDYTNLHMVRNATLKIYPNNSFPSYRRVGFSDAGDKGKKLNVVGHVVSIDPLAIRATMTDIGSITRFVQGRKRTYPIKGEKFQIQLRGGHKTMDVEFGRGPRYVRLAGNSPTVDVQRDSRSGRATFVTVSRPGILTNNGVAKPKSKKKTAKKPSSKN